MLYRNKKNGSIINIKAQITGKNWELVEDVAKKEPVEVAQEPKETKKKKNAK